MYSPLPSFTAQRNGPSASHCIATLRAATLRAAIVWMASLSLCALSASGRALGQTPKSNEQDVTQQPGDDTNSRGLVRATYQDKKELRVVSGELVATDKNLGHLILDADGHLTAIPPNDLKRIEDVPGVLSPVTPKEIAAKVLQLMPARSKSIVTDHFVVCYNTSDVYARWNSSLYERLYKGFFRFWKEKGVELTPPRFPLVAVVFETKQDYVRYASNEFEGAENTIGYYHQSTNRLASYDLTGIEGMLQPGAPVLRDELINQILMQPQAERTVATIVHEACHQISFNCGLQVRLGDNPLWLSEGLATFFESPDGSNPNGWGGTGKVNKHNLVNLAKYLPVRPVDSLQRLLMEDHRLRSGETSASAYAEAWGLTYYLLKSKPKQFVTYLNNIREKPPGNQSDSKARIELFQKCFGDDLAKFDKDFIRFMQKVR
ncbi:MAG: DUF1570 domain-containing protein [Pirellula sp.]